MKKLEKRMKTAQHFYDCICPSLVLSVLFGISPIFITTQRNNRVLYTSKYLYLINISYVIVFTTLSVQTVNQARNTVMSNSYYEQNKVSNVGIGFVFASGILYVLMIYICGFYRTESIKHTLERFAKVDRILEKLGQEFEYMKSIIYQVLTQLAPIFLICFTTMMQHENVKHENFQELPFTMWVVFVFPAFLVNVFENHFVYTVLLIYQRFKMVSNLLGNMPGRNFEIKNQKAIFALSGKEENNKISLLHKINILMRLHDELCDISRVVNRNYILQEVVVLMFQFGILLFSVFYCYWMFRIKPVSSVCWLLWSSLKATEVLHVTISCHLTSKQAKQTGAVIHKLLITTYDLELKKQLMAFSNQVLHRRVNFTVWGILTLNTTLLFTMIGAASTYIVIMLQFQQASLPMTCKASMGANATTIAPIH